MPGEEGSVVDTTGARGVFSAGILAALYKGHDWTTAGCVVNAVGARATTEPGAAEGACSQLRERFYTIVVAALKLADLADHRLPKVTSASHFKNLSVSLCCPS